MQSIMSYEVEDSSYSDENHSARKSDFDFLIKEQFYEEFKKAVRTGFKGTYDQYLQYRDYT